MSNHLTKLFSYEGNQVTFKNENGVVYVNATEMAKPFGKKPNDYLRLPGTVELVQACARKSRTSESQLVISKMGSAENGGGTWLHENIAIDFAQWLSVDFRLWCNDRLKEFLSSGSASVLKSSAISRKQLAMMIIEQEEENERLQITIEQQTPAVILANAIKSSPGSIALADLAKILNQNGINIGRNRLFEQMRMDGYLSPQRGIDWNMPKQRYVAQKLFWIDIKPNTSSKGPSEFRVTLVTGKGIEYFTNKYLSL